jgi:signal transduction histidine kinase/DNA-binding response OmpR family regulator
MARILIIEDQPASRDLLVSLLGYQGHVVFEAHDGAEGLALALAEQPDMVITDILMPEMDGYEFARRVRADAALAQTRIVFYTATYIVAEVRKLAAECGVQHVLSKPADPEKILGVVDEALNSEPPAAILPPISGSDHQYLRLLATTLHRKIEALKAEARAREQAEEAIRLLNVQLEQRVEEQLRRAHAELIKSNASLQAEIAERKQLEHQIQLHAARATALAELTQALAEMGLEYRPLLDTVARRITELVGDVCVVNLLSEDGQSLEAAAIYHADPEGAAFVRKISPSAPYPLNDGPVGRVVQTGQALLVPVVPPEQARAQVKPQYWPYLDRFGIASMLIVPLRTRGRILGALGVSRSQPGRPYTLDDQTFLQDLADRAGQAIENARLFVEAQQARAEADRASLAKSEFLSSMSHELRTPLNAIIGFTGTLLMKLPGPLTADQEKQLTTVRTNAQHLLSLISDILDLAKIESGKVDISLEPVEYQAVIEEVATSLRPLAEQKGIEFTVAVPAAPIEVQADRRALSQILINLANNAIKFTDHGAVHIALSCEQAQGRCLTKVSVADTGIGITAEDQTRLFQAFEQAGVGARRRGGSGLGLYLSQRLAQLLGGQITFQSEYGKGSMFTLVLPGA